MSDPLDVHQNLEHCMRTIEAGREAMAHDMHDAAMRLGVAEMMLASASHAVHNHAAALRRPTVRLGHPMSRDALVSSRHAPVSPRNLNRRRMSAAAAAASGK